MGRNLSRSSWYYPHSGGFYFLISAKLTLGADRTWSNLARFCQAMAEIPPGNPVADDVVARGDWSSQVCTFCLGMKVGKSDDEY